VAAALVPDVSPVIGWLALLGDCDPVPPVLDTPVPEALVPVPELMREFVDVPFEVLPVVFPVLLALVELVAPEFGELPLLVMTTPPPLPIRSPPGTTAPPCGVCVLLGLLLSKLEGEVPVRVSTEEPLLVRDDPLLVPIEPLVD